LEIERRWISLEIEKEKGGKKVEEKKKKKKVDFQEKCGNDVIKQTNPKIMFVFFPEVFSSIHTAKEGGSFP